MSICPHCGYDASSISNDTWDFTKWVITTQCGTVTLKSQLQAKIFDLLYRRQGTKGLTRERIVEIIYMNNVNGYDSVSLTRVISRVREQIETVGIHLRRGFSGGEGYSLMFVTPEIAKEMNKQQSKGLGCKGVSKPKTLKNLEPVWMSKRKLQRA